MNKIVQIAVADNEHYGNNRLIALRSDGTMWLTYFGAAELVGETWHKVPLPPGTDTDMPWGLTEKCSDSST